MLLATKVERYKICPLCKRILNRAEMRVNQELREKIVWLYEIICSHIYQVFISILTPFLESNLPLALELIRFKVSAIYRGTYPHKIWFLCLVRMSLILSINRKLPEGRSVCLLLPELSGKVGRNLQKFIYYSITFILLRLWCQLELCP